MSCCRQQYRCTTRFCFCVTRLFWFLHYSNNSSILPFQAGRVQLGIASARCVTSADPACFSCVPVSASNTGWNFVSILASRLAVKFYCVVITASRFSISASRVGSRGASAYPHCRLYTRTMHQPGKNRQPDFLRRPFLDSAAGISLHLRRSAENPSRQCFNLIAQADEMGDFADGHRFCPLHPVPTARLKSQRSRSKKAGLRGSAIEK